MTKRKDMEIARGFLFNVMSKALCHVSMPQRQPKRKRKPAKASQQWNKIGGRK